MILYISKIIITSILVILISEISKRSSFFGALLASVPMVSILALIWLYVDTKNIPKIIDVANHIFWFVFPSIVFFIVFPLLLKRGIDFYFSLGISVIATLFSYFLIGFILNQFGIKL